MQSSFFAGCRDVLAGESSGDDPLSSVLGREVFSADVSDIPECEGVGVVSEINCCCISVNLAKKCCADRDACLGGCEAKATDTAKEVEEVILLHTVWSGADFIFNREAKKMSKYQQWENAARESLKQFSIAEMNCKKVLEEFKRRCAECWDVAESRLKWRNPANHNSNSIDGCLEFVGDSEFVIDLEFSLSLEPSKTWVNLCYRIAVRMRKQVSMVVLDTEYVIEEGSRCDPVMHAIAEDVQRRTRNGFLVGDLLKGFVVAQR